MTNQEAYDKATRGLLFQNKRCVGLHGECVFINEEGLRCALGFLVPDELLFSQPLQICDYLDANLSGGLQGAVFAQALLVVHNDNMPNAWPILLRNLAVEYNLNTKVLDETLAELAELDSLLTEANQPERSSDPAIAECVPC